MAAASFRHGRSPREVGKASWCAIAVRGTLDDFPPNQTRRGLRQLRRTRWRRAGWLDGRGTTYLGGRGGRQRRDHHGVNHLGFHSCLRPIVGRAYEYNTQRTR